MSYTTLYRIDSDGNLSAVAEIRNSHGGQPLVWDLLEDEFDPPSPAWLHRYSFLARDGKISGRWMFDSGDPQTAAGGCLDRCYKAIARTDLPESHRLAFAATHYRTWIAAGHCERIAAALEEVSNLASETRVNHLPAIAAHLRRAPAEGWMGVYIYWSSLNDNPTSKYVRKDEEDDDGEYVTASFADQQRLWDEFHICELFELRELADLAPAVEAS